MSGLELATKCIREVVPEAGVGARVIMEAGYMLLGSLCVALPQDIMEVSTSQPIHQSVSQSVSQSSTNQPHLLSVGPTGDISDAIQRSAAHVITGTYPHSAICSDSWSCLHSVKRCWHRCCTGCCGSSLATCMCGHTAY